MKEINLLNYTNTISDMIRNLKTPNDVSLNLCSASERYISFSICNVLCTYYRYAWDFDIDDVSQSSVSRKTMCTVLFILDELKDKIFEIIRPDWENNL